VYPVFVSVHFLLKKEREKVLHPFWGSGFRAYLAPLPNSRLGPRGPSAGGVGLSPAVGMG
jgi:hypothetical protein